MSEILSKDALSDLRRRVLAREQPSQEELRAAVHTLREGRTSAAVIKTAKAKKSAEKKAPLDLSKLGIPAAEGEGRILLERGADILKAEEE